MEVLLDIMKTQSPRWKFCRWLFVAPIWAICAYSLIRYVAQFPWKPKAKFPPVFSPKRIFCLVISVLLAKKANPKKTWKQPKNIEKWNGRKCLFICPPCQQQPPSPPVSISSDQAPGGLLLLQLLHATSRGGGLLEVLHFLHVYSCGVGGLLGLLHATHPCLRHF